MLGGNKPIYHIKRHIEKLDNAPFNDMSQIIYINGAYKAKEGEEKTSLMKLIEDFHCAEADDMNSKVLADRMEQIKNSEEEMNNMCKEVERYANKKIEEVTFKNRYESVKNLMNNLKMSAEQALVALSLKPSDLGKYASMLQG